MITPAELIILRTQTILNNSQRQALGLSPLSEKEADRCLHKNEAAQVIYISEVVYRGWEKGRPPQLGESALNNYKRATELLAYKLKEVISD